MATAESTPTPLAVTHEAIPGLTKNSVTFANIVYTLTDGFVSNQDPQNYADQASPEPTEATRVFLLISGKNPTSIRPELSAELFNLVLGDGKPIAADPLFGDGEDFGQGPMELAQGGQHRRRASVDTQVGWLIPASATAVTLQVGDPTKEPGTIAITLP